MVYFQVRRGLLHKGARRQLREFDPPHGPSNGLKFERRMWDDAANAWARFTSHGRPLDDDADLLMAGYARSLHATLVTNNTSDCEGLGARLASWFG